MSDLKKQVDDLPNKAVKDAQRAINQVVAGHNLSNCMACDDPGEKGGKSKSSKPKSKSNSDSKPKSNSDSKPKSDSDSKPKSDNNDSDSGDSGESNDDSKSGGSFEHFGQKESTNIAKFLQSMTEKNYAEANKYLKAVVDLKIAGKIRNL